MDDRQRYALQNVVTDPEALLDFPQEVEQLRDGNLLLSTLAIDR
jgi:hypothetical protein